jgi:uncharacterized protein YoxC
MVSLNKLEKVIELEEKLRKEYEQQLDARTTEIETLTKQQSDLQETVASQKATIEKQLATITDLSSKSEANQRVEQLNRELNNRAEKLQEEVAELKKRVKTLQKDLAEERTENKALKQFDPPRMKKNLDANKKKLAEKTRANDLLQKSLNKARGENTELEQKVKELEAKLAALEPGEEPEVEQAQEEAAA